DRTDECAEPSRDRFWADTRRRAGFLRLRWQSRPLISDVIGVTATTSDTALMISSTARSIPITNLVHPLPNLCAMSAPEILAAYRTSQFNDVKETLARVRCDARDLTQEIGILKRYLAVYPNANFRRRLQTETIEQLFRRMHEHVMSHPVWIH